MTLSEYDIVAITEDIATHHQTTGPAHPKKGAGRHGIDDV